MCKYVQIENGKLVNYGDFVLRPRRSLRIEAAESQERGRFSSFKAAKGIEVAWWPVVERGASLSDIIICSNLVRLPRNCDERVPCRATRLWWPLRFPCPVDRTVCDFFSRIQPLFLHFNRLSAYRFAPAGRKAARKMKGWCLRSQL